MSNETSERVERISAALTCSEVLSVLSLYERSECMRIALATEKRMRNGSGHAVEEADRLTHYQYAAVLIIERDAAHTEDGDKA